MERRDIIIDEIEKLSNLLKKIIEKLFQLNTSNTNFENIDIFQDLMTYLNISWQEFENYKEEEILNLCRKNNFNDQQLHLLAEIFVQLCHQKYNQKYLFIALTLLKEENKISDTYSKERNDKILRIEQLIKEKN